MRQQDAALLARVVPGGATLPAPWRVHRLAAAAMADSGVLLYTVLEA